MQDIAEKAGVSVSTVSRALRDKTSVSTEAYEQIKQASNRLGYSRLRRRAISTDMKLNSENKRRLTGTIGLIADSLMLDCANSNESHYHAILKGVIAASERRGFQVSISSIQDDETERIPLIVTRQKVDGLILTGSRLSKDFCRNIKPLLDAVPVVMLNKPMIDPPANAVIVDNLLMMQMAVSHLAELGHRRIAYFDAERHFYSSLRNHHLGGFHYKERKMFFQDVMEELRLDYDDDLCVFESVDDEGWPQIVSRHFKRFMSMKEPPTAIITRLNLSLYFVQEAIQNGLEIPADVSLLATDESSLALAMHPTLTTVGSNYELGGELAVNLLLNLLRKTDTPSFPQTIRYQPKLTVRESTGPVQGRKG